MNRLITAARHYGWAPILLVVASILRVWNINTSGLWYDESFTVLLARLPLPDLLLGTAGDVHPPLYYLLVSGLLKALPMLPAWAVVRGLSVALSVAACAVAWYLYGLLGLPSNARAVALALLASNPVAIFYGAEGRQYALLGLLVTLQFAMMYKRRWVALGLVTLASLYTHNYGLIYTGLLGMVGVMRELIAPRAIYRPHVDSDLKSPLGMMILSMVVPGALYMPWAMVLGQQIAGIQHGYWIQDITAGGVVIALVQAFLGNWVPARVLPLAVLVLGAVLVLLARTGLKNKKLGLLVWALGPVAVAVVGSLLTSPMLLYRGLTPSLPALAGLAGLAFTGARGAGKLGRWGLLVPVVLALGWQIGAGQAGAVKSWVHWPAAQTVPAGAVVVHLEDTTYITSAATWPDAKNYLLLAGCPEQAGALSQSTRAALGVRYILPADIPDNFYFAGVVGPLSTRCHEDIFNRLSSMGQPVYSQWHPFGVYGVWYEAAISNTN